jgi:hypothetical protein
MGKHRRSAKFSGAQKQSTDDYRYVLRVSGVQRSADATLDISGDIEMNMQGINNYAYATLSKIKDGYMFRVTN